MLKVVADSVMYCMPLPIQYMHLELLFSGCWSVSAYMCVFVLYMHLCIHAPRCRHSQLACRRLLLINDKSPSFFRIIDYEYVSLLQLNEGLRQASINAPIPSMILQVWLLVSWINILQDLLTYLFIMVAKCNLLKHWLYAVAAVYIKHSVLHTHAALVTSLVDAELPPEGHRLYWAADPCRIELKRCDCVSSVTLHKCWWTP